MTHLLTAHEFSGAKGRILCYAESRKVDLPDDKAGA